MSRQTSLNFRAKKNLNLNFSPKKSSPVKQPQLTPSTALSELKLSTPKTCLSSARRALHCPEVLQLPGRENEIKKLEHFLLKHLDEETSGSIYMSGLPGTGKTATLSLVVDKLQDAGCFKTVFINCTTVKTPSAIYRKICEELKLKIPSRGRVDKLALVAITNYLMGNHKMILLLLDEIDQLESKHQSVLYSIFEWTSIAKSKLVLVGVANAVDLTDRTLPRICAALPENLHPVFLNFPPYTAEQIITILKHRLAEVGESSVFGPGALQLLAAKVATQSGDTRRALDLAKGLLDTVPNDNTPKSSPTKRNLTNCSFSTNNNGSTTPSKSPRKSIEPQKLPLRSSPRKSLQFSAKDVLTFISSVNESARKLDHGESVFPLHQKLLICSLMLSMKGPVKEINIGKLHELYGKVCKTRGITPVDQSSFVALCRQVEVTGAVKISAPRNKNGPARLAKISLQWDESEVATAVRDTQLLASIIADVSCLKK